MGGKDGQNTSRYQIIEQKKGKIDEENLVVCDVSVLAYLRGDGGTKLGDGHKVVEIVDLHDGGEGSAGSLEEIERALARFLQAGRVGRNLNHLQRRKRHDPPALSSPAHEPSSQQAQPPLPFVDRFIAVCNRSPLGI